MPTIGAEGHAAYRAKVPLESQHLLAGASDPNRNGPIRVPGNQPLAIGTEGHARDGTELPVQRLLYLTSRQVPQPDLPGLAGEHALDARRAARQGPAVGGIGNAEN